MSYGTLFIFDSAVLALPQALLLLVSCISIMQLFNVVLTYKMGCGGYWTLSKRLRSSGSPPLLGSKFFFRKQNNANATDPFDDEDDTVAKAISSILEIGWIEENRYLPDTMFVSLSSSYTKHEHMIASTLAKSLTGLDRIELLNKLIQILLDINWDMITDSRTTDDLVNKCHELRILNALFEKMWTNLMSNNNVATRSPLLKTSIRCSTCVIFFGPLLHKLTNPVVIKKFIISCSDQVLGLITSKRRIREIIEAAFLFPPVEFENEEQWKRRFVITWQKRSQYLNALLKSVKRCRSLYDAKAVCFSLLQEIEKASYHDHMIDDSDGKYVKLLRIAKSKYEKRLAILSQMGNRAYVGKRIGTEEQIVVTSFTKSDIGSSLMRSIRAFEKSTSRVCDHKTKSGCGGSDSRASFANHESLNPKTASDNSKLLQFQSDIVQELFMYFINDHFGISSKALNTLSQDLQFEIQENYTPKGIIATVSLTSFPL